MAKVADDKMQMIGAAVILQAEQERKKIIEEANALRIREVSSFREALLEEMFQQIQDRTRSVRQRMVGEKSVAQMESRRRLLTRRMEFTNEIFTSARDRLVEYAGTEAYRQKLLEDFAALGDQYDHAHSLVQVGKNDLELAERIQSILPGCKVEAAKDIRIGGFRLRNRAKGTLLDETLDRRLEEQRPWFLQNCGLQVTD